MTLKEVLNLMDDEVWVRVRVHGDGGKTRDLVLWSADWIGGGIEDPGMPDGLEDVLEWDADDMSIEMYKDPEGKSRKVPMLVVNAYDIEQPPVRVFVLEKLRDYGYGVERTWCRTFLDEGKAKAAMRDDYDSEVDAADEKPDPELVAKTDREAVLRFSRGVRIDWFIHEQDTEDAEYSGAE